MKMDPRVKPEDDNFKLSFPCLKHLLLASEARRESFSKVSRKIPDKSNRPCVEETRLGPE